MISDAVGDSDRASSLVVDRGLYLLRYTSSSSPDEFPTAQARSLAESQGAVQVISAPGTTPGELREPGACVVLVARSKGTVEVSVRRRRAGTTLDAVIQLEPLGIAASGAAEEPSMERRRSKSELARGSEVGPMRLKQATFSFIAHISRRGDVEVTSGEWAAGPAAPSAIEGLQLIEPLGGELPIEIQVRVPGPQGGWTPWAQPGVFAGTRGRALPIVGLRARLAGELADELDLCAEALFLGAAAVNRRGGAVELFGPYETDPLVGLRLWLESRSFVPARAARTGQRDLSSVGDTQTRPVRVFRSESAVRQSV